jgi:putative SOS response-associated peptidase YedK
LAWKGCTCPGTATTNSCDQWLDADTDPKTLVSLLRPFPAELMEGFLVSRCVNRTGIEGADLIEPLDAVGA